MGLLIRQAYGALALLGMWCLQCTRFELPRQPLRFPRVEEWCGRASSPRVWVCARLGGFRLSRGLTRNQRAITTHLATRGPLWSLVPLSLATAWAHLRLTATTRTGGPLFRQNAVRQAASRRIASRRANAHMGGRRSAATERVQGRITSDSKRPPHSHFSVSTAARRAPPRVHDHDARDGLMMGWVLGGGGNVLDIGLSRKDGGDKRKDTQHARIGTPAKSGPPC